MIDLFAQIIIAARNGDGGAWQQMLVLVLLAVFWAVGGILKAKAGKSEQQKEQQKEQQQPRHPPRPARRPQARRLQAQPVKTVASPKPAGPEHESKVQRAAARVSPKALKFKTSEQFFSKPVGLPEGPLLGPPEASAKQATVAFEFDDPDTLRKAILHYEILGKPLALRDRHIGIF